jgi:hypothetical protein
MCFAALLNGDATRRSLSEIIRAELSRAVANGAVAALLVVGVLAVEGTPLGLAAVLALGALLLGTVLHQAVLAGGVLVLRGRRRFGGPSDAGV